MVLARVLLLVGLIAPPACPQSFSFLPPVDAYAPGYSRGAGMCRYCFAVADFNHDGKADIVYAFTEFTPTASVAFGNGDGTFRAGPVLPVNQSLGRPYVADFNGDGNPDIAISNSPFLYLFLGDGSGGFSAPISYSSCPSPVVIADFDGDGKSDLVCGQSVLLGSGDGAFRTSQSLPGESILAGDLNEDSKPDLLLRVGADIKVALGKGNGTFDAAVLVRGTSFLQEVQIGDFNSDGHVDIVGALIDTSEILMFPGNGDSTFRTGIHTAGLYGFISAAADFNRDGKLDLIAGDAILPGNGDGTFRFPIYYGPVSQSCGMAQAGPAPIPCDYYRTTTLVADFNGDGLPDIAAGYVVRGFQNTAAGCVTVLLNDSPGDGFTAPAISPITWSLPIVGALVTAFGENLAPSVATAPPGSPQTTLGGIRLHLRQRSQSADALAPLLYVSPSQINYAIPPASLVDTDPSNTDPYVWVAIEHVGTPYTSKGLSVPRTFSAVYDPFFFTVGSGLAAATAVSVALDGTQTSVPVNSCVGGVCTSTPINVSGDPVYLTLYGTGFASSAASCNAGQTVPVTYTGRAGQIAGLDRQPAPAEYSRGPRRDPDRMHVCGCLVSK